MLWCIGCFVGFCLFVICFIRYVLWVVWLILLFINCCYLFVCLLHLLVACFWLVVLGLRYDVYFDGFPGRCLLY